MGQRNCFLIPSGDQRLPCALEHQPVMLRHSHTHQISPVFKLTIYFSRAAWQNTACRDSLGSFLQACHTFSPIIGYKNILFHPTQLNCAVLSYP